jgi:hypothetical protein
MPITPSPIQVSATPYDNSGILAASGDVSATYPGPWRIETQTLRIDYERVPYIIPSNMVGNVNALSGTMSASGLVQGTSLVYRVTAEHKISKSYDIFDTSTYVQNQRFKIVANTEDAFGNTYGDLSAGTDVNGTTGSQFALGPLGAIITEEPYYNRRLWDDDLDATSTNFFQGCDVRYFVVYGGNSDLSGFEPFTYYEGGFFNNHFLKSKYAHSFIEANAGDAEYAPGTPRYYLLGGYDTAKEDDTLVLDFIDEVGSVLSTPHYADTSNNTTGPELTKFYTLAPSYGTTVNGIISEFTPNMYPPALTQYNILRHDFS